MAVLAGQRASEIVVDARGNAYVNGADFGFVAGEPPKPGYIKLLTPDGRLRQVAGPDGITMDAEGAVWVQTGGFSVVRVAEGGQVLQRIELEENRVPFALMLGGPDRRTLFICTAEWHLAEDHVTNLERLASGPRTGNILALAVDVPGAGRP